MCAIAVMRQHTQYHNLGPANLEAYISDPTLGWVQSKGI
jgi:hypothetical protein